MRTFSLHELGWQPFFERQVGEPARDGQLVARVSAHHGGRVTLLGEDGEFSVPTSLLNSTSADDSVAVGDWFLLYREGHRAIKRLERKTQLSRKAAGEQIKPQVIVANVDTVFIVTSCNQEFNLSRIERYLALILESGAVPVVVLTKADLCDDPAEPRKQTERLHPGLIVEVLDARDREQTAVLNDWCVRGKTIALLGSSGVGKSTLANAMGGYTFKTAPIRSDDDKGRHTTTARSMHRLEAGGWLIDNPGMRELQLADCEQGVTDLFQDVLHLAAACQFRNCSHQGDVGCAVEAAVADGSLSQRRLSNYLKLQSEQARNTASLAERREKDRKTGRLYKRIIADKRQRHDLP